MKRLLVLAAALLGASAAQAGESYSFQIDGRTMHIDVPKNCSSPSCISVRVPGIYEPGRKHEKPSPSDEDDKTATPAPPAPAAPPAAAVAPAPAAPATNADVGNRAPMRPPATANVEPSLEPANGTPAAPPVASAPAAPASPPPATAEQQPATTAPVIATAPATPPIAPAPAPAEAATGPIGVWLTEEKEGKVRIEPCGANLCGYSVDAKTNANGAKVLINMKPTGSKWAGRIHDPNSGSTYDSTIAMRGSDKLRVQGCAFGGMFCGGQTWTRVN